MQSFNRGKRWAWGTLEGIARSAEQVMQETKLKKPMKYSPNSCDARTGPICPKIFMYKNAFLIVLGFYLFVSNVWSDGPPDSLYRVTFGTLEINDDYKRRYVFCVDGREEVYDLSTEAILRRSGVDFPGLPNLKEVGFRTTSGQILKYGNVAKNLFVEKYFSEHPEEKGQALIFKGLLDEDLEVNLKGKTKVCRVDFEMNGQKSTLWKNLPKQ